jgi:hypothetical protein
LGSYRWTPEEFAEPGDELSQGSLFGE